MKTTIRLTLVHEVEGGGAVLQVQAVGGPG